jgi:hypothetical protein
MSQLTRPSADFMNSLVERGRMVVRSVEDANLLKLHSVLEESNKSLSPLGYHVSTREVKPNIRKPIFLLLNFIDGKSSVPIGPITNIGAIEISDRIALYF